MRRIIATLALALCCTAAPAQTPAPASCTQLGHGGLAASMINPAGTVTTGSHWIILLTNPDGSQSLLRDQVAEMAATPQTATITTGMGWIMITWPATPAPAPAPAPAPTPAPAPAPAPPVLPDVPYIVGSIKVMTIYDGPTAAQQAVIDSSTIAAKMTTLKASWFPCTTATPGIAGWLKLAKIKAAGCPTLVFITTNAAGVNSINCAVRCPDGEDNIVATVLKTRTEIGTK